MQPHSINRVSVRTTPNRLGLIIRQRDSCRCVRGNGDCEAMIALLPVGNDCAVGGVVFGVKLWKRGIEMWVNREVMIAGAGCVSVDAGGAAIDPRHY